MSSLVIPFPADKLRDLPDATYNATLKINVQVVSTRTPFGPLAQFDQSIPVSFTLAPHHDYTNAPGHRAAFERALNFSNIHLTGRTLHLTAIIKTPPVGFAHNLVLKSAKGDLVLDPLICPAGRTAHREFHIDLSSADLPTARLHFIPLDAIVSQIAGIPVVWSGSLDRPLPINPDRLP